MDRLVFSRCKDPMYSHVAFHSPHVYPQDSSRFPQHTHDVVELLLFQDGQACYDVEGKSYPLYPNTLIITRPGVVHQIRLTGDATYERYVLRLDLKEHMPEQYPILEKLPDVMLLEADHPIVQIFHRMDAYYRQLNTQEYSEVLNLMIREIVYNLVIAVRKKEATEALPDHPMVRKVVAYIQENLTTLQDNDQICNALFISKSHLHHLFLEQMHMTPKKYILTKRLMLAQSLLHSGEHPSTVYSQCGFGNYTTFFRCYKQYFGHTPSEAMDSDMDRDLFS